MNDQYTSIKELSIGEFKDRGSKFIAYAYPIEGKEEVKPIIEQLKKEHFKACHHCYAWRLGVDGKLYRANDDGEPSGTAGRPILGQIDSFGLSDVLIVVVRYYGGTKLGTSGLKNAYKLSAFESLNIAETVEKIVQSTYEIDYDYSVTAEVMNFLKQKDLKIIETNYGNRAVLKVRVRKSEQTAFEAEIKEILTLKLRVL